MSDEWDELIRGVDECQISGLEAVQDVVGEVRTLQTRLDRIIEKHQQEEWFLCCKECGWKNHQPCPTAAIAEGVEPGAKRKAKR